MTDMNTGQKHRLTLPARCRKQFWCVLAAVLNAIQSAALFAAEPPPNLPAAFDAGWQGHKTCELLYETAVVRVGQCTFPPGIGHEKHFHYPHFGYVLQGATLRITDDQGVEGTQTSVTGTTWSTDAITVHEALNIGATTAIYLIVEPIRQARHDQSP